MNFGAGEFYALASAAAWAVAVILFSKAGEQLAPFPLNLVKNALAGALLALTLLAVAGPTWPGFPAEDLAWAAASGVLGIALGDTLYFRALKRLGASRMGVAQTLYSPFVILLSVIFLGERLRWWQLVGLVLVLLGIAMVSYAGGSKVLAPRQAMVGFAIAAASVLAMAAGIVIAKPLLLRHEFLWVVFLRTAAGVLGMLLVVALRRQWGEIAAACRRVRDWRPVFAGGFCGTYLAMMIWLAGYKYTDMAVAAVLNELAAVFILLLAVLFLRERVGARQLYGTLLAVLGVALVVAGPTTSS